MNSASRYKTRGSILLMTLLMTALMTTLALAGLQRTQYQSQLTAGLARQASLQAEAAHALAVAALEAAGGHAQSFTPGCPPQCNWQTARRTVAADGVTAAYIAQRIAPGTDRFLLVARASHTDGGEALGHALFDADRNAFHFVR